MRVKMLNSRVGVTETFNGGTEYDLPEARALRWVESGFAMLVDDEIAVVEPVVESAVVDLVVEHAVAAPVVETAVKRGRPRK